MWHPILDRCGVLSASVLLQVRKISLLTILLPIFLYLKSGFMRCNVQFILFLFEYKYKKDLNVQRVINQEGFCDPFGWNKINFNLSMLAREGAAVFIWQVCGHTLSEAHSKTKRNKSVFTNLRKPALQSTYYSSFSSSRDDLHWVP